MSPDPKVADPKVAIVMVKIPAFAGMTGLKTKLNIKLEVPCSLSHSYTYLGFNLRREELSKLWQEMFKIIVDDNLYLFLYIPNSITTVNKNKKM